MAVDSLYRWTFGPPEHRVSVTTEKIHGETGEVSINFSIPEGDGHADWTCRLSLEEMKDLLDTLTIAHLYQQRALRRDG